MSCKIVGCLPNSAAQAKQVAEKYAALHTPRKRNKVKKALPAPKGKTNVGNPRDNKK